MDNQANIDRLNGRIRRTRIEYAQHANDLGVLLKDASATNKNAGYARANTNDDDIQRGQQILNTLIAMRALSLTISEDVAELVSIGGKEY